MSYVFRWNKRNPLRLVTIIFAFSCIFHLFQIYLESKQSLETSKRTKHFLFLAQERKHYGKVQDFHANSHGIISKRRTQIQNSSVEHCRTKSVLFLKTHKTGSTTITNIILRHAMKNQLKVGLPLPRHWQLGGYPSRFDETLVLPRLAKYDVLCHHLRYDHKAVRSVLPTNAKAITIIRDPAEGFESGFAFFRDWPYPKWFKNISAKNNLKLFLDQPYTYYNTSTPWYFRAKNYMAFDLGFSHDRNDMRYADIVIKKMEKWFDLVLITDRMDESLLLLKDMLCMDSYEDIAYLRLKVRQDFARRDVTREMEDQMRAWNLLDTKLYKHFNKVLNKKVEKYGLKNMKRDLKKFRNVLTNLNKKCVNYYDEYKLKPWVSHIELNENSGEFCEMLSWGEVKFGDYMREFQEPYIRNESLRQPNPEEIKLRFERSQIQIIGEEAAKNSA